MVVLSTAAMPMMKPGALSCTSVTLPSLGSADSLSPGVQPIPGRLPESARGVFKRDTLNSGFSRYKTGLRVLLHTGLGVLLLLLTPRAHLYLLLLTPGAHLVEDARQA